MAPSTALRQARRLAHQLAQAQRRGFATSPRSSKATAADAASYLLENFSDKSVVRRQFIDANQLQKLALTLGQTSIGGADISDVPPAAGTPVPQGYHLVYFTPNGTEKDLGADGTDRTFNASAPFTRRMWAGGKMKWPAPGGALLRVGDEVEERTRLLSATAKKSRSAGEMVLVEVEKEFWGPDGLALVDRRSWVFRPEIDPENTPEAPRPLTDVTRGPSSVEDLANSGGGFPTRELRWSPAGLFRFSALTFNGHMIHYNEGWTRNVESHPSLVVHGPLNLINLLNYWKDVHGNGQGPRSISYRAMSPLYAGQTYHIRTADVRDTGEGNAWDIIVERDGVVCMKSEISTHD
ncbi:hypothetical protein AK830_g3593 [Neonectria ditissima]|uniref:Mesaconyl-C(4)-CoA hydratase n=1 Tax=Neonectria ditissima TaxID=78410 RepID=A0A0P7AY63_9HYPO|nr:hypothetical protein AK830_g3593 [Neonectria ditissima]